MLETDKDITPSLLCVGKKAILQTQFDVLVGPINQYSLVTKFVNQLM